MSGEGVPSVSHGEQREERKVVGEKGVEEEMRDKRGKRESGVPSNFESSEFRNDRREIFSFLPLYPFLCTVLLTADSIRIVPFELSLFRREQLSLSCCLPSRLHRIQAPERERLDSSSTAKWTSFFLSLCLSAQ